MRRPGGGEPGLGPDGPPEAEERGGPHCSRAQPLTGASAVAYCVNAAPGHGFRPAVTGR
ncbi:hypothetical protein GCM10009602_68680 [Nocardiopsis tropica]